MLAAFRKIKSFMRKFNVLMKFIHKLTAEFFNVLLL